VHSEASARPQEGDCVVVVPCFNEAKRLDPQAFSGFLEKAPNITLVFVDDGSVDDTPLLLERLRQRHPKQVRTLRLNKNAGKGEAVRRGVQIALRNRPSMVGYWDADLATPLDAIPRFCKVLGERAELELVMGSRVALLGRTIRRSTVRHFMGRVFATAASLILRLRVYDTQCGAKLFRVTPTTTQLFKEPFNSRWFFDVEILARMIASIPAADDVIYEYPLEYWEDVPGSRLRPIDFLAAAVDLATIHWRHRRGRHRQTHASCTVENSTRQDTTTSEVDNSSPAASAMPNLLREERR